MSDDLPVGRSGGGLWRLGLQRPDPLSRTATKPALPAGVKTDPPVASSKARLAASAGRYDTAGRRESGEQQAVAEEKDTQRWDVLPVVVLVALVLLMLLGWWLYPKLQHYMSQQDCIATGRTNCE